ncbi:hypothetical protein NH340_JMT05728 [Sarcoptes scabiei]|nr:hypothetical protein NH340_JMT05728 [Sarcoptes scabiei]
MAWWKLSYFDEWFSFIGITSDPRTQHLLWINFSPFVILWAIFNFCIFALIIGPRLMQSLSALDVRWLMFIYNCLMSVINIYAVIRVIPSSNYFGVLLNFDYPDRNDTSAQAIHLIHLGYMYWLTKVCDLWDTCFFVVRKKFSQITLLHVYHHTVVPVFGYLLLRINPLLPCVFLFLFINSMIHVIMYSYYALSALGPSIQPYLWWKKYITLLQLWQFVLYGAYGTAIFFLSTNYPIFWLFFGLTQPPLFFWLFYDFYKKAYFHQKQKLSKKKMIE